MQEALTNVLKHAPGARTWVDVEHAPEVLRLEVRNDAPRVPPMRTQGSGRGVLGMQERCAVHGGDLHAGPDGAGWSVTARLPLLDRART